MSSDTDCSMFEDSESVTSGSEYVPSENDGLEECDSDSCNSDVSGLSISDLQVAKKIKPQVENVMPLVEGDDDSNESTSSILNQISMPLSDADASDSSNGTIMQKAENLNPHSSNKTNNFKNIHSKIISKKRKKKGCKTQSDNTFSPDDSDSNMSADSNQDTLDLSKKSQESKSASGSASCRMKQKVHSPNFKSPNKNNSSNSRTKAKKKINKESEIATQSNSTFSPDNSDSNMSVDLYQGSLDLSEKSQESKSASGSASCIIKHKVPGLNRKSSNKNNSSNSRTKSKKKINKESETATQFNSTFSPDNNDANVSLELNQEKSGSDNDCDIDWEKDKIKSSQSNKAKSKEKVELIGTSNSINNTLSEQSSIDLSLSLNLESVGPVIRNKFNEIVPDSSNGCKKNCCYYCLVIKRETKNPNKKVLYAKLVEHYEKAHKTEYLIDKLLKIKPKKRVRGEKLSNRAKKRLKILETLRLKANHLHNLQAKNVEEFVVTRRPKKGKLHTVAMYKCCLKCHKRLSISSMHKHVKTCTGIASFAKKRIIRSGARAVEGDYHEIASEGAIKIISVMRESPAVNEIRYDKAVIIWLNAEASTYEAQNQKHNHIRVRANINRLGNLLIEMKKLNPNIKEFSDIFHEIHYDDLIKAVKIMGKPHPVTKYLQSPATANDMFHLIKSVSEVYDVTMGSTNEKKRLEIQAFERKLNRMWHKNIGNTIAQTQANRRKNLIKELPTQPDMQLLRKHLENEITFHFQKLKENYSDESYEGLRNALLSYLQFTNCRRPGEVERMEMIDFEKKQIFNDDYRIEVRGKRSRPVPIVFTKKLLPSLDLLVLCRSQAKIDAANPFFFANIQDVSTDNFSCASGVKLMKHFSEQCGAEKPTTLRATLYRMQLATDQMEQGIDEHGVEQLSGFMGHTPRIHRQNYRQSVIKRDVQIAKKVRQSQGITQDDGLLNIVEEEEEFAEESFEPHMNISNKSLEFPTDNLMFDNSNNSTADNVMPAEQTNKNTGRLSAKKYVTRKRVKTHSAPQHVQNRIHNQGTSTGAKHKPWLGPAKKELLEKFPFVYNPDYKVPSAAEIIKFLKTAKDPLLRQRTEPQVRSHIHTERKNLITGEIVAERPRIPNWIYTSFQKYIAAKKMPSHSTCAQFLGKSPSKNTVTIGNIQDWVKKAIEKSSN